MDKQDTEASVGEVQVPQIDPEVIGRQIRLVVTVDGDGVDVVGVSVGVNPPRTRLHHQIHRLEHWNLCGAKPVTPMDLLMH